MERYSISFKEQVVSEYYNEGVSRLELCRRYNIGSATTISRWLAQLGSNNISNKSAVNVKLSKRLSRSKQLKLSKMVKRTEYEALAAENKRLKLKLVNLYIEQDLNAYRLESIEELFGKKAVQEVEKLTKKSNLKA